MKNHDKNRIEEIVQTRKQAHSYYSEKSPVYRSFVDMGQNTYKDGRLKKKIKESEARSKEKIDGLETFHDFAADREFKMVELKKEINELCEKLGEKPRYDVEE